jgi:general secretion pathway protein K
MSAAVPRSPSAWARARARRRQTERGVALIMVLGAIAVMVVMLADFQDDAGAEFAAATAARDSVQAEYFARSALNLERLLIASEPLMRQAITPLFALMKATPPQLPVWDYSDRILGAFNDADSVKDFAGFSGLDTTRGKNLGLQGGHFEVTVVDEDAKINVNMGAANEIAHIRLAKELMAMMAPIQYDPLFSEHDATGNFNDRLTICSSIVDWADPDEQLFSCDLTSGPSSNAVEDSWYQLLPKPYRRKNAPYDSLEELRMVRGMSDNYWSTFVDPEPTDPKKRLMTVWGQGKINVNSANPLTLYGLVCSGAVLTTPLCTDPNQMQLFVMGLMMAKGMTMGAPLFGTPTDFVNTMEGKGMLGPMLTLMGMQPVKFQSVGDFTKNLSTTSKVFSIYSVGAVKGFRRETRVRIHIVVDFRGVGEITQSGLSGASTNPNAAAAQQNVTAGSTTTSGPITDALQANIGGKVLYFNIE